MCTVIAVEECLLPKVGRKTSSFERWDMEIRQGGPGSVAEEPAWVVPFRRALALHGRPGERHMWQVEWMRRLDGWVRKRDKGFEDAVQEDVEAFLAHLATSPAIAAWQLEQA